jgi:hypothetical protein
LIVVVVDYLIVVVVDYGFAAITVRIFLFNYGGLVTRRSLLNDCGPIAITITVTVVIMRLADRHASAHRTYANSNIVRKRGRRNCANYGGNKQ